MGSVDRRALAVLAGVLVLLALSWGWRAVQIAATSDLTRATETVPAATKRMTFTDWAAIRAEVGSASGDRLAGFLRRAYDRDLSQTSDFADTAETGVAVQRGLGFGPANARWEAYAQSTEGAALVLKMTSETDFAAIRAKLRDQGYRAPKADDGVWQGGADAVAAIDPDLPPDLGSVVLLESRHLVVASDAGPYAALTRDVIIGRETSLRESVAGQVKALGDPASAYLWRGDFVCTDLGMNRAGVDDQAAGDRLVDAAGGVDPLDGAGIGMDADRKVRVALRYETSDQAERDLKARGKLFVGPNALGIGSLADEFELTRLHTEGAEAILSLTPKSGTGDSISALSSGAQLFMTC